MTASSGAWQTWDAQFITHCSASTLTEKRTIFSPCQSPSPAKTRPPSRPSRARGHHFRPSTNCEKLSDTGYGPLCAGVAGLAFFTFRNRWDVGGVRYFPAGQAFMQPAPKRHHLAGPLALSSAAALHCRQHVTCDLVLAPEDDGLAAWLLRLGPNMHTYVPDPIHGGGQYLLVAGGTLLYDGARLPLTSPCGRRHRRSRRS